MNELTLQDIDNQILECKECFLGQNTKLKHVPGEWAEDSEILFVGEGPGLDEGLIGRPFCLEENHKVLMLNLTWKPLKEIQAGDEILTLDEFGQKNDSSSGRCNRRWRKAIVTNVFKSKKEVYKFQTEKGALLGTLDHKILSYYKGTGKTSRWLELLQLVCGSIHRSSITFIGAPWEQDKSWKAGWLTGFFNGEGHLCFTGKKKFLCGYTQNRGLVNNLAQQYLQDLNIALRKREEKREYTGNITVRGHIAKGFWGVCEFLGRIRPERLLRKFEDVFNSGGSVGFFNSQGSKLISKNFAGMKNVVDIQTTSGTFIADGFVVHNCGKAGKVLDKMLTKIGLKREGINISNTVCCRPPGNRKPTGDEIYHCHFYLNAHINILKPKIIVTLGATALNTVLGSVAYYKDKDPEFIPWKKDLKITKEVGKTKIIKSATGEETLIFPLLHPAALLHSAKYNDLMDEGLKELRKVLNGI